MNIAGGIVCAVTKSGKLEITLFFLIIQVGSEDWFLIVEAVVFKDAV